MNAHACARESVLNVFATYLCEVAFCSNQACLSSSLNKYASMSFLDIQHFSLDVFGVCLHFASAHSCFL